MKYRPYVPMLIALASCGLALAQSTARITPNFKDADITQIIEAVGAATGRNFIIDPRVRAQVTMLSTTPMTPEQFYQAFLSILAVHGFVAVPSGNLIKVLPDANMRQLPANDLPGRVSSTSDEIVTQVVAVKSVSAAQLVPVLRPYMPQNAQLASVTGTNLLIITDRANNVSRMMRIIERVDQESSSGIAVIPLQNASAGDIARVLNSMFSGQGDAVGAPRIAADDRSNSIMVSGDRNVQLRVRALVVNLDTPVDAGGETQVRYLEYADAEDMATKLKGQFSGSTGNQARALPTIAPGAPGAATAAAAGGAATLSLEGGTATIWADKDTNALIITAPQRTMRALNSVIDKLDIRRAQVLVEAIIAEVSASSAIDLGVNWIIDGSASGFAAGGFVVPVGAGNPPIVDLYNLSQGNTSATFPTGTILGVGRLEATGVNFAAVLKALATDTRNNIILQPQLVTQDNQEAKIEVAREVPFITGQYTSNTGTATAFQTIQREQVGTILTVTPQINKGDAVMLKIQVESSALETTPVAGAADLVTQKRTVSTTVLIKDGGTLVLGGLTGDQTNASENRVPLLGRIPIFGELFRSRSRSTDKRNLMIFIKPRILRDDSQAAIETGAKYNFLRDQIQQMNRETTLIPALPLGRGAPLPEVAESQLAAPAAASPSTGEKVP